MLNSDPINLINVLETKKLTPEKLTPHQRKIIVRYYMENESQTSNIFIAELIGVSDVQISRIKRRLLEDSAWKIEQLDIKTMAVALKKKKEEYQRKAASKEDYGLAWKMELDYIDSMQKLGFIYKAPDEVVLHKEQADFRQRLKEFFNEFGVPTADQFFGLLESVRGNRGGKERTLPAEEDK